MTTKLMEARGVGFECKDFKRADEVRKFEKGKVELLHIGDGVVGRTTLEPGWRWSKHVKPLVGKDFCEAAHCQYHISGRLHVRMQDGTEFEVGPGEVSHLLAGHDAWVVGNDPVVLVDWAGMAEYAKRQD